MYRAKFYVVDDRPKKPKKAKKGDRPKGGWANVSGQRKVRRELTSPESDPGAIVALVNKVLSAQPEDNRSRLVKVVIERESGGSAEDPDSFPLFGD